MTFRCDRFGLTAFQVRNSGRSGNVLDGCMANLVPVLGCEMRCQLRSTVGSRHIFTEAVLTHLLNCYAQSIREKWIFQRRVNTSCYYKYLTLEWYVATVCLPLSLSLCCATNAAAASATYCWRSTRFISWLGGVSISKALITISLFAVSLILMCNK